MAYNKVLILALVIASTIDFGCGMPGVKTEGGNKERYRLSQDGAELHREARQYGGYGGGYPGYGGGGFGGGFSGSSANANAGSGSFGGGPFGGGFSTSFANANANSNSGSFGRK